MKASRLGFLSVALVFGLSACEMLGPGPDPIDPDPIIDPDPGSGGVPVDPDPIDPDPIDGEAPTGTFGVSTSASGPFTSDVDGNITSDDDDRIITVSGGDTFYAEVAYADTDGIADVDILLVNDEPAGLEGPLGTTPQGGFTLGEPTDCDLSGTPETITCVYPITVAPGTPDIEELPGAGDEFAYVFRTEVTDTAGNVSGISDRGYVNVE